MGKVRWATNWTSIHKAPKENIKVKRKFENQIGP
jgi:hypothetical protein